MVVSYTYPLPSKPFNPNYLRGLLDREFKGALIGWRETPKEIRFDFARPLTPEEKSRLDAIMAGPLAPASSYEFGALDLYDEVEKLIGVRPVFIEYDEARGRGRAMFDGTLTPDQESKLNAFFSNLKTRGLFKKRGI
jgi:hypothetical protein